MKETGTVECPYCSHKHTWCILKGTQLSGNETPIVYNTENYDYHLEVSNVNNVYCHNDDCERLFNIILNKDGNTKVEK